MAADKHSRSRERQRQYEDHEWDAHKGLFRAIYVDQKNTLKEAAKIMREEHGFDASLRQWERRISPAHWNFTKYTTKEARMKQIAQSGRALHDIAQPGRRPVVRQNGDVKPQIVEHRNLRRFARRHLNTPDGRPRAHSAGDADRPMPDMSRFDSNESQYSRDDSQSGNDSDETAQPVDDVVYDVHMPDKAALEELNSGQPPDMFNLPATRADPDSESPVQLHVFRQNNVRESSSVPQFMLSTPDGMYAAMSIPDTTPYQGDGPQPSTHGYTVPEAGHETELPFMPGTDAGEGPGPFFGLHGAGMDTNQYDRHDMPWQDPNQDFQIDNGSSTPQVPFGAQDTPRQDPVGGVLAMPGFDIASNAPSYGLMPAPDVSVMDPPLDGLEPTVMTTAPEEYTEEQSVLDPLQVWFQMSADDYGNMVQEEVGKFIYSNTHIRDKEVFRAKLMAILDFNSKYPRIQDIVLTANKTAGHLFVHNMGVAIGKHVMTQQQTLNTVMEKLRRRTQQTQRNTLLESVLQYRGGLFKEHVVVYGADISQASTYNQLLQK